MPRPPIRRTALAAALMACLSGPSPAADRTWDGDGKTESWSYSAGHLANTNWTHATPADGRVLTNGDRLFFDGSGRLANRNDYQGLVLSGLEFREGAGAFTLSGNALALTGDLVNRSARHQELSFARLVVAGPQVWDGGSGGMNVTWMALGDQTLTLQRSVRATAGTLAVGSVGRGELNVRGGSQVEADLVHVAEGAGSSGTLALSNGRLHSSGLVYVGTRGAGRMTLAPGAELRSNGGHVGRFAGAQGQVRIDAGALWDARGDLSLRIGYEGEGQVDVDGGRLFANNLRLGELPGGQGTLRVADGGTVEVSQALRLGDGGAGRVEVLGGGRVYTGQLVLNTGGLLRLDGGTLGIGNDPEIGGGRFEWVSGTLEKTALWLDGSSTYWGQRLTLGDGQRLQVVQMRLAPGSLVTLDPGAGLGVSGTLGLHGGTVVAPTLDLGRIGQLYGGGRVLARVHGGDSTSEILLATPDTGGALALGDPTHSAGVDYRGRVGVFNGALLTLMDADTAHLGGALRLGYGGRIAAANGLALSGETMDVFGPGHIDADLRLDGTTVRLTGGTGARLALAGHVTGDARFALNGEVVAFGDRVAPGGTGIGRFETDAGTLHFGADSLLVLDLVDGTGHDRLGGADTRLQVDGAWLRLDFAGSFAAGATLDLLDFAQLDGGFAVSVRGIDAARLDLSRLQTDGTLHIAALAPVPEPAAWALMAIGLATLQLRRRGLTRAPSSSARA